MQRDLPLSLEEVPVLPSAPQCCLVWHTRARYLCAIRLCCPVPVSRVVWCFYSSGTDAHVRAAGLFSTACLRVGSAAPNRLTLGACQGVIVRFDEERCDLIKVLIIGSIDTPYAGGCFEYHIW